MKSATHCEHENLYRATTDHQICKFENNSNLQQDLIW